MGKVTIVEFTGVTGVGKTTLWAAVKDVLSDQGIVARDAYDVILARYGLNLIRYPKLRSVIIDLLTLFPFLRYISTGKGLGLLGLAIRVIRRDARGSLTKFNLARNFAKQIGVYVLLAKLRRKLDHCDFVICDEGTLHIAHNLFVHTDTAPDPREIVDFSNMAPKPDIVIWVKATKEQSIECILRRGHPRVKDSSYAAQAFVKHGYFTFSVLCSDESVQDKLFVIDNSFDTMTDKSLSIQYRAQAIAARMKQSRTAIEVSA